MTENAYENRDIGYVTIERINACRDAGPFAVRCKGRVELSPSAGVGPSVGFELSFEVDPSTPFQDVQREALNRGYDLLRRVAAEPLEALQAKLSEALA